MKITVGKSYEGCSSMRLTDGDYELKIDDIKSTKGRVNMTLVTATGTKIYKTFFLLEKDGKTQNERGMKELADYITTAMQIEEEETEVVVESAVGFYLLCYVKNAVYTSKEDGSEKRVYNVYSPRRCNGFSATTGEEQYEEEYAEEETEDDSVTTDEEIDDIMKKYGLGE